MRTHFRNQVIGLLKEIKGLEVNSKCSDSVLVLDELTTPLLSSAIPEFLALGVKDITKATLKKKPCPHSAGIYYISQVSLPLLSDDFRAEPPYHSINLVLNEPITQDIMKIVVADKHITDRLAYFGELRLNVKYLSENLALICREDQLFASFLKRQQQITPSHVSGRILEAILGGFKNTRKLVLYHSCDHFIQDTVKELTGEFKQHLKTLTESDSQGSSLKVVLVDRTMDLVSPLVSNFYYLNLISDIFRINYHHNEILLRNSNKIKLNFDDPIFRDYKNLHIAKVQAQIEPDLQKFKTDNKAAQVHSSASSPQNNQLSNRDMQHIIGLIPEYGKKVKSYENNVNISFEIAEVSKEEKLPEIGEIEQLIVSGVDGRGEEVKDKRVMERAQELCLKIKDPEKIVKIMLLMLLCLECSQSQRKLFLNKIREFHEYRALADMAQTQLPKMVPKPLKLKLSPSKPRTFLQMHECLLESILADLIEKKKHPLVSVAVVGTEQKKVESKFQAMTRKETQQWLVVVLGGISLNEIVQLERLQQKHKGNQVSFLSSEVLTTWNYLDRLGTLFQ